MNMHFTMSQDLDLSLDCSYKNCKEFLKVKLHKLQILIDYIKKWGL